MHRPGPTSSTSLPGEVLLEVAGQQLLRRGEARAAARQAGSSSCWQPPTGCAWPGSSCPQQTQVLVAVVAIVAGALGGEFDVSRGRTSAGGIAGSEVGKLACGLLVWRPQRGPQLDGLSLVDCRGC
jgi:hypothetical protein